MAFIKRDVKDRVVQYPRRYQMVEVQPGIFDLIPMPGTITEPGTAINKAFLQPIEDGLDAALEKTGDGKDVIVTFAEAATEAHIASGEKLSVLFGKILKKFKSIVPVALGGTGAGAAADARTNLGVPPIAHAVLGSTYGLGSPTLHGHVKTINTLTQASHVDGTALSAYQGKVLNDSISNKGSITSGQVTYTDSIPANGTITKTIPIGSGKKQGRAVIYATDGTPARAGLMLFNTDNLESVLSGYQSILSLRQTERLGANNDITGTTGIGFIEFYISGTNLRITFKNVWESSPATMKCNIAWEVW